MRLTLVRHCQSEWNATGRWQGQSDIPLSPKGRVQAHALASRLYGIDFTHAYCSDLSRARETAAALGHTFEEDQRLREIDVGRWAGLTRPEVDAQFADQVAALGRGEPVEIGGGESVPQLDARADSFLGELRSRDPGHPIVVTHGGIIRSLVTRTLGRRGRITPTMGVSNGSITRLRWADAAPSLEVYNDRQHLPELDDASGSARPRTFLVAIDAGLAYENAEFEWVQGQLGVAQCVAPSRIAPEPLPAALLAESSDLGVADLMTKTVQGNQGMSTAVFLEADDVPRAIGQILGLTDHHVLARPSHANVSSLVQTSFGWLLADYGLAALDR